MIELRELRKKFGNFVAVDDVSFRVEPGEVLGFLGPNGAGKSTTMRMITGFLSPTSGTVKVCGRDVRERPLEVKRHIGYLPEGAPAYPDMTPESFLRFIAEVRGFKGRERRAKVEEIAQRVHLEGMMHQPIEILSKGYKRRVGLAQALLHDPEVLILDEPTDGLDPNQKHEVRELIRGLGKDKVIILSTHILEEVEAVCTRAAVITRGRVVADASPRELQERSPDHNTVVVRVHSLPSGVEEALRGLSSVRSVRTDPVRADDRALTEVRVAPKNGASIVEEVSGLLRDKGAEVEGLRVEPGRLDVVFRELTAGDPSLGAGAGRPESEKQEVPA